MGTGQAFGTGPAFVVLGDVQQTEGEQHPVGADESQQQLSDVAAPEELDLKGKSELVSDSQNSRDVHVEPRQSPCMLDNVQ